MFSKIKLSLFTGTALLVMVAVGVPLSATADSPAATGFMGHVAAPATANPTKAAGVIGHAARSAVQDVGLTLSSHMISTAITLKMSDAKRQELADFIQATVTPGNPQYRKFLTVEQFRQRFAPSSDRIQGLVAYLNSHGIKVTSVDPDGLALRTVGSVAQFDGAFSMQIHDFMRNGQRFHGPASSPVVPAQFSGLVLSMPGLNSETGHYKPKNVHLGAGAYAKLPAPTWHQSPHRINNGTATGDPEYYTVGDVANFYQVNPFYMAKIRGQHQTIGIMTLASFNYPDVFTYWSTIGLPNGAQTRSVTKVPVDGGTPVSCYCGNDETTLDVEQSGGLAYKANILVYIAPNTDQGFNDVFAQAVNDNTAGTLSISWGEPEVYYFPEFNGGTDYTYEMMAIDQYLMQGAAQGQSIFAASGDSGAFDTVRSAYLGGPPYDPLSVDYPSSDPYMTAAGGTTASTLYLPGYSGANYYCNNIEPGEETVWGWDYFYYNWNGCDNVGYLDYYSVGGGGGISVYWPLPNYQKFTGGIRTSFSGQTFDGYGVTYTFPSNFAGRNTPDLSLNADPYTGYSVYVYSTWYAGYGGTSFVAPQLNGITALINQAVGTRVGFLNPSVYLMQQLYGTGPPNPFNYVYGGDNWFFCGNYGCGYQYEYNNGPGIGSINAGDLALAFGWKPPYVVSSMLQKR